LALAGRRFEERQSCGEPVVGVVGGRPSRAFIVQEGVVRVKTCVVVVVVVVVVGRSVV
jgi:hypothetical protein